MCAVGGRGNGVWVYTGCVLCAGCLYLSELSLREGL